MAATLAFRTWNGIALALALLASCAASGTGRESGAPARERASSDLQLALSSEKSAYELGEPVYVTARLVNVGSRVVAAPSSLRPASGALTLEVLGPAGERLRMTPLLYACGDESPSKLEPGAELVAIFPAFFGAEGWAFRKPGTYRVQAHLPELGVSAEPLSLFVEAGPADGAVASLLEGPAAVEVGKLLVWQAGDHLGAGLAALEGFVAAHPESALGQAALFVLGRVRGRPFRDYAQGRVRPADFPGALELLARTRDERLPPYLRIQKLLLEAHCYAGLGDPGRARERVAALQSVIGGAPEFDGLARQARELAATLAR